MALTEEQKKYLEAKRVVVEYERKYPQHPSRDRTLKGKRWDTASLPVDIKRR